MFQEAEPLSGAPVRSYMLLGKVTPPVQSDNVNVSIISTRDEKGSSTQETEASPHRPIYPDSPKSHTYSQNVMSDSTVCPS